MAEKKKEEEKAEADDDFERPRIKKKYTQALRTKGLDPDDLARLYYEGKIVITDDSIKVPPGGAVGTDAVKKDEKKEEKKAEGEVQEKVREVSNRVQKAVEDVAVRQVESAVAMAEENFKKRMQELEERAKKADELEKKLIEKEKAELEEKIKYLEEHKETLKREVLSGKEALKEFYKGGSSTAEDSKIQELEKKIEVILERLNANPMEQYKQELERMAAFKKAMDEKFKELFPDYVPKKEEKTDWDSMLRLFAAVSPMISGTINNLIGTFTGMKQVDVYLAKAEKAKNEEIAKKYLELADLIVKGMQMRMGAGAVPQVGGVGTAGPVAGSSMSYEDLMVNMLGAVTGEDLEKFKKGELSIIPYVESNLQSIVNVLRARPDLLNQVKALTVERVIERIRQVRKDIVMDDVMVERIRSELETVKQMILDEIEGFGSDSGTNGTAGSGGGLLGF